MLYKIVIDTSVLISGLYSNKGAAFKLLEEIDHSDLKGSEKFGIKTITPKELLIKMGVVK
jgi:aspartokinase-like uncharacterized kinase